MQSNIPVQTDDEDEVPVPKEEPKKVPPYGTIEYLYYLGDIEGHLPSPINVSITRSVRYACPELKWYNYDVYPHKIKLTNTGYTVLLGAKWKTERPYLEGGPLLEKHVISQVHFHWGPSMMEGSDHTVDKRSYPAEMHVTYFRSEYLTQEEALRHTDGVMIVCYIIKFGVEPDPRIGRIVEGFSKIRETKMTARIGPYPMSQLMPMFSEDFFMYWGELTNVKGESFAVRWVVPRVTLFATMDQMKEFRKLLDPWDEPNLQNFRPLHGDFDRHVLFINAHWCQYNSLLPIPRVIEPSISILSSEYQRKPWMLPAQNSYMLPPTEEDEKPKLHPHEHPS